MKIPPHRDYIFEGKASSARFLPVVDVTAAFAPFPPGLPPFPLAALPVVERCDCCCFILLKEVCNFKLSEERLVVWRLVVWRFVAWRFVAWRAKAWWAVHFRKTETW